MVNEAFGWVWIVVGLLTGAMIGVRFTEPDWLGGYQALPRRLVRLGHISLIGLGALNIMFAHSLERIDVNLAWRGMASIGMVVGGVTMPLCCGLTAWRVAFKPLFVVPILCLLFGTVTAAVWTLIP